MAAPLSKDLRERIVNAYEQKEGGYKKLAKIFKVGVNSVRRFVELKRTTNSLAPKPPAGGPAPKITKCQTLLLQEIIAEKPDRTLPELAIEWNKRNGTDVHRSSVSRAILRAKITRKKNVSGLRA
jgi:putative transposase